MKFVPNFNHPLPNNFPSPFPFQIRSPHLRNADLNFHVFFGRPGKGTCRIQVSSIEGGANRSQ
ncbi:hypothetical protein HanXRQr2_Chr10g0421861 [Helianthus annuus]|uniref:Uncharacterized protein n=1 Tax=Helianthus annuus TaxID=4232 RepID=A0A9K3N314_HELAN|nr:hypothetical protein HanXRQr2_Chr10g0421861 [Helianthus annuus]